MPGETVLPCARMRRLLVVLDVLCCGNQKHDSTNWKIDMLLTLHPVLLHLQPDNMTLRFK